MSLIPLPHCSSSDIWNWSNFLKLFFPSSIHFFLFLEPSRALNCCQSSRHIFFFHWTLSQLLNFLLDHGMPLKKFLLKFILSFFHSFQEGYISNNITLFSFVLMSYETVTDTEIRPTKSLSFSMNNC